MADAKISELTAIDAVAGGDLIPIVDDPAGTPATKKATASQIKDYILALANTWTDTQTFANVVIGSANTATWSTDLILSRREAANLRLGAADATNDPVTPAVAQTLSVQSIATNANNTNRPGKDFTITGSQGTGTGAGGKIIFQVAPAGNSGTSQNALATALTIASDRSLTLTGSGTASIANSAVAGANNSLILTGSSYVAAETPNFAILSSGIRALWIERTTGQHMVSGFTLGWSSSATNAALGDDTILARDAADTLALRRSTNAQAFRIYNTYTDASNYERGKLAWESNVLRIGTENAGTGTARGIEIQTGGVTRITISAAGAVTLPSISVGSVTSSGFLAAAAASGIVWTGRSYMTSPADSRILLQNNANTDFDRLQFGGTTSSFPALKRSSTTLQVRLADDSDYAPVQGKLTTETAYTAGAPTATGYIVLYDSTGTAYKVPAEAL